LEANIANSKKDDLRWAFYSASIAAKEYVARENAAGNAGQELFDSKFRALYCAHHEAMRNILHMRSVNETAIVAKIDAINALADKVSSSMPIVIKPKVKKPGSAAKRHTNANLVAKKAVGGGKKRRVKACKKK